MTMQYCFVCAQDENLYSEDNGKHQNVIYDLLFYVCGKFFINKL